MIRKASLALVICAFLAGGGVAQLQAREHNDRCEQHVQKAEANLRKAVSRHGEHSRQAEQRRREVEQARANCGGEHHDRR